MKSIQQNGKKEVPTDEQASSWKKAMNSIQHNGKNQMLKFLAERKQWSQFNRMQEKNLEGE